MKVILTQAVPGLGDAGAIKEVADGYARNYLLPRKMAVAATRSSMKQAEAQADMYARRATKALTEVQKLAATIQDKTVTIRARVGSENRLYGSVTSADIADALASQHNVNVDRRRITLDEAIHRTGTYSATADLGNGASAKFNVEVAPEVAGASGRASRASAEPVQEAAGAETEASDTDTSIDAEAPELSTEAEAPEPTTEAEAEEESEANPT